MRQSQKILTGALWGVTVVALFAIIGAGLWHRQRQVGEEEAIDVLGAVPPYSLLDQDGKGFGTEELKGKVYVADYVFTRCSGPCPLMTQRMSELSKRLPAAVHLVSISVEPEYDRPAILKEYAKEHGADESRWHFLTGTKEQVFAAAQGMLVGASPATKDQPIVHSIKFVLIDAEGRIRGQYDSDDEIALDALVKRAGELASGRK